MSLQTEIERGALAREVLDNPVYTDAWGLIEKEIIEQWRAARNAEDREQLHKLLLMHAKAKVALESVMRTGRVAEAEITRQQTRAEQQIGYLSSRRSAA